MSFNEVLFVARIRQTKMIEELIRFIHADNLV
jgi:hypothetical protein